MTMSTRRSFIQKFALGASGLSFLDRAKGDTQDKGGNVERPKRKWPQFTTRPVILARRSVVTSGHYLATAAGFRMFEKGGNAFDAAVAMGFACSVLEPQYYGIGGEVSILVYSAREKRVWSVSGQGTSPRAATIAWFKEHGIDPIPSTGFLPATVPAPVSAW